MIHGMFRKSAVAALLVMVGALNACTYWNNDLERIADESDRDFRRNLGGPFTHVDLRKVLANPSSFKYIEISFDAILNHVSEKAFIPFWTTFSDERHLAFSAWPADAKLWESDERGRSHPLFYVLKDSPNIPDMVTAGRFSLVRISGQVMGDYELKAWIFVSRVEIIEPHIYTDDALADLSLAKLAIADKKPAVAIRHYENALAGIWTTALRLEIHLNLARLYEGRGDLESALNHYRGALTNAPDNDEALKGVERTKTALANKEAAPQQ